MDSAFDDSEYQIDIFGNEHGALYGNNSEVCEQVKIISVKDGNALIYVPQARKAVLIDKAGSDDVLHDVNIKELDLDCGTNAVKTEKYTEEEPITIGCGTA